MEKKITNRLPSKILKIVHTFMMNEGKFSSENIQNTYNQFGEKMGKLNK